MGNKNDHNNLKRPRRRRRRKREKKPEWMKQSEKTKMKRMTVMKGEGLDLYVCVLEWGGGLIWNRREMKLMWSKNSPIDHGQQRKSNFPCFTVMIHVICMSLYGGAVFSSLISSCWITKGSPGLPLSTTPQCRHYIYEWIREVECFSPPTSCDSSTTRASVEPAGPETLWVKGWGGEAVDICRCLLSRGQFNRTQWKFQ